jgi:MFS superfamily sulfate permease-like transporter
VVSVIALPTVMNLIPLATLAAILLVVGYKLAKPQTFRRMFGQGFGQFAPFMVTILGIVFTDLLFGIGIGVHAAILVILFQNFQLPFKIENLKQEQGEHVQITLAQNVTFLNKASVLKTLDSIPEKSYVMIDTTKSVFIHPDVVEILDNYLVGSKAKDIEVEVLGLDQHRRDKGPKAMRVAITIKH